MRLEYPNKKTEAEILAKVSSLSKTKLPKDTSLFIAGDNFAALSSLIESGYSGTIDLVYIDPPYNTKQSFTVNDDRVSTISRRKSATIAYSDHMTTPEYLEFMRERLILLRELLSEQGSLYLHIDNKMGHYIKIILDEIFGVDNFKNDIARIKSNPKNFMRKAYGNQKDVVLFYAKNKDKNIFNNVTDSLTADDKQRMFKKIDEHGRRYNTVPVHAPGETSGATGGYWRDMLPPDGRHWRTNPAELDKLDDQGLIEWSKNGVPRIKKFADEHKGKKIQDIWHYIDPAYPLYPTEKNADMLEMIIKQSSHEDSIVLDCFAGSGSTLLAAQNTGRRWIGIDQSAVSHKVVTKRFNSIDHQFIDIVK